MVPVALLAYAAWRDVVPFGVLAASGWPIRSPYLRGPVPENRVVAAPGTPPSGAPGFRLAAEPIYVEIQQPRPFRTLDVALQLDPGSAPVVELGLAPKEHGDLARLQPAYHRALETLAASGWAARRSDGLTLLERQPVYGSVDEFLRHPPSASRLAVYRIPFPLALTASALPPDGPARGVDFILTGYQLTGAVEGWRAVRTDFTLTPLEQAAASLRLVLSVPERPLPSRPVGLAELTVRLTGEPLSRRVISGWLARWFRR